MAQARRLQCHAALGTGARRLLSDLRVHGAGVGGVRLVRAAVCLVQVTAGIRPEFVQAVFAAKVIGLAVVFMLVPGAVSHFHTADRINVPADVVCSHWVHGLLTVYHCVGKIIFCIHPILRSGGRLSRHRARRPAYRTIETGHAPCVPVVL